MTTKRNHFTYLGGFDCPACKQKMHVDPYRLDSLTRIVMCVSPRCSEFGYAWRINIRTSVGESERPDPDSPITIQ